MNPQGRAGRGDNKQERELCSIVWTYYSQDPYLGPKRKTGTTDQFHTMNLQEATITMNKSVQRLSATFS